MTNNYAVIENGKVVNLVVSDADFAAEQGWVLADEGVDIGWDYNDNFVDNRPKPIIVEQPAPTKEQLLLQLQELTTQIQSLA